MLGHCSAVHLAACLLLALVVPATATAQGLGLGPRFSFVRGDIPTGVPSTRLIGGVLRMGSSRHLVIEAALDYRTEQSDDGTSRLRERPLQGSVLVFPVRSTFSPYLLAGIGLYAQTTDTLDEMGLVTSTTSARRTGMHMGFGAEVFVTRRTAVFADYRYRFVRFGAPAEDEGEAPIGLPGLSTVKLAHRGSMWTSGVAFYF